MLKWTHTVRRKIVWPQLMQTFSLNNFIFLLLLTISAFENMWGTNKEFKVLYFLYPATLWCLIQKENDIYGVLYQPRYVAKSVEMQFQPFFSIICMCLNEMIKCWHNIYKEHFFPTLIYSKDIFMFILWHCTYKYVW